MSATPVRYVGKVRSLMEWICRELAACGSRAFGDAAIGGAFRLLEVMNWVALDRGIPARR